MPALPVSYTEPLICIREYAGSVYLPAYFLVLKNQRLPSFALANRRVFKQVWKFYGNLVRNNPSVIAYAWHRLGCRLGRCFCFAEVSTGHPHPYTGEAVRLPSFRLRRNRGGCSPRCGETSRSDRGDRRRQRLSAKLTEGYSNVADVLDIAPEDLIQAAVFPDRIIKAENNKKNTWFFAHNLLL